MSARPWQTYILKVDSGRVFISGGKNQGIKPGMIFTVLTQGEKIKSPQTGSEITLPGAQVAKVQIQSNFGENDLNEGSIGNIVEGSISGQRPEQLIVRYEEKR